MKLLDDRLHEARLERGPENSWHGRVFDVNYFELSQVVSVSMPINAGMVHTGDEITVTITRKPKP